jgi:RNA polymerase sigma factor (sigma-70 family)
MTGDPRRDLARTIVDERVRVAGDRRRARDRPPTEQVARMARAAAKGDAVAWEWLVARFHARLVSAARGQGLAHHDAEDAAQATWIRLTAHIGRLRDPGSLGAWLITTAQREGLRIGHRGRRERPVDELPVIASVEGDPDRELLAGLRSAALAQALGELPERHRDLMLALASEPAPSYEEISARLGVPIGSIGPTRARCLARLRREPELLEVLALDD